ncbi:hypothetical protein COLO4_06417 [Corchorus olitorius]|uniref:Uncharacterized protein n=1 Tax=Corchorus olitorius TaxID=93759 RepID=A0A1R3KN23_9ROSI|nr:hypothetical protein COLO4_06417 [Corchorus olitorius]
MENPNPKSRDLATHPSDELEFRVRNWDKNGASCASFRPSGSCSWKGVKLSRLSWQVDFPCLLSLAMLGSFSTFSIAPNPPTT